MICLFFCDGAYLFDTLTSYLYISDIQYHLYSLNADSQYYHIRFRHLFVSRVKLIGSYCR